MKRIIFLFLLMMLVESAEMTRRSVVTVEGGVVMGNTLPRWGFVCVDTDTHGSPRESSGIIGDLHKGERVRLREQSRPTGDWVMIAPAEWIPLKAVCW